MRVDIHQENERGDILTLLEDLTVVWRDRTLTVPKNFECDGASVPRMLWSSISPRLDPRTLRAAVVHDYLYRTAPPGWSRKDADELFYDFIREDGLSWFAARKAYWGLRLFGGGAWKGKA